MRVLVLTPGFVDPAGRRSVPAIVELLAGLRRRHHLDIHLISSPPENPGHFEFDGLPLVAHGRRGRIRRLSTLAKLCASRRPDLIWSLWLDRSGRLARAMQTLVRRPLLASVLSSEALPPRSPAVERTISSARVVTVGSHRLAKTIGAAHVRVTPLGVPAIRKRPQNARSEALTLLAVTHLQAVKQPHLLVETVRALAARGLDPHLDLYGYATPADLDRLRTMAREADVEARVRHRGFIDPVGLRDRYADYDLLLHASRSESQGMAMIEAAAANLPIACFDVGVASELRALGANVNISEQLTDAALTALDRPAVERSGEVLARFSLETCTDRFDRALQEAAG